MVNIWRQLKKEPHWPVIVILLLLAWGLFVYHLITGYTPPREAFVIPLLNLAVYWYGLWIVGGIALGAWVAARLAYRRGVEAFETAVPLTIRQRALSETGISAPLQQALDHRGVRLLGDLLLKRGFDPRSLNLNQDEQQQLAQELQQEPGLQDELLQHAPWRIWNPDHVWNGLVICLLLGVVGARLYHVLTPPPSMAAVGITSAADYLRNPGQLINLRNGGLGIYGGLAGGLLGLWIYTRRHRLSLLAWSDLAAVGVALGQVFGRWGNFFNQELYGRPTTVPWAITIDPVHRLPAYAEFATFHPAFLYESLWSLLAFAVLYWLASRRADALRVGELTALYLIFYAVGRTLLELVRLDSRVVAVGATGLSVPVATAVSLALAGVLAVLIVVRRRRSQD